MVSLQCHYYWYKYCHVIITFRDLPRFPIEIFLILDVTEHNEKKVTNLVNASHEQLKKISQITQYTHSGLVKMTILEPDLSEPVQSQLNTDKVNLSYFQLINQAQSASNFQVSFEKWFNVVLEEEEHGMVKKKSTFLVDDDDDDEDNNNTPQDKVMQELYEPSMKRKKRHLGKVYARVEYLFEDMQGFPLSYQTIQSQIREAMRVKEELMRKMLQQGNKKDNTAQKKLLGMFQDSFVEDEEEVSSQQKVTSQQQQQSNPQSDVMDVRDLISTQKRKHRRHLVMRRYRQELDRVISDRNEELLKRAQESQKSQLEMLHESIQDKKKQYENIEFEFKQKGKFNMYS